MKFEKPKKSAKEERRERMKRRGEYVQEQAQIAIHRDGGFCVFCWFWEGKRVPYEEVHHFFGRGRDEGDSREHYTSLVCTCKPHHPGPVYYPEKHPELMEVLGLANSRPINRRFKHQEN